MPNCHMAERTQETKQGIEYELEMAWRRFQKKNSCMKIDKSHAVMVKRAGSGVRWAWIWIPTLPLASVRPGMSYNLFEATKNPSKSPHCPRDSITSPKMAIKTLHDLAYIQFFFLCLLLSLHGPVSDPWMFHVLPYLRDSACAISPGGSEMPSPTLLLPPLPIFHLSCPFRYLRTSAGFW